MHERETYPYMQKSHLRKHIKKGFISESNKFRAIIKPFRGGFPFFFPTTQK